MIIIVEGIDRVGKTTLCNMLSEKLDMPIYKHGISRLDYANMDTDNETDKMSQLIDMVKLLKGDVIFDRFHLSEYVYGEIERHYDNLRANANFKLLDNKLVSENAILVLVQPTDVNRSSFEHGMSLLEHNRRFINAFKRSNLRKLTCTYDTLSDIVEEISNEYRI